MVKHSSLPIIGSGITIIVGAIFMIIAELVNPQFIDGGLEFFPDANFGISSLVLESLLMFLAAQNSFMKNKKILKSLRLKKSRFILASNWCNISRF